MKQVDASTPLRILYTGGASGGHFYPLVALYSEARERWPHHQAVYVGSCYGLEAQKASTYPWSIHLLPVQGLRQRHPWSLAVRGFLFWKSLRRARRIVRDFLPHRVVSTGGYAGAAPALVAESMGIPVFVHEQNIQPGWATRLIARRARGLALTYPTPLHFSCPTKITGNPVRPEFFHIHPKPPQTPPYRILVLGGSQGSHYLNMLVPSILPDLKLSLGDVEIYHQSGPHERDLVYEAYKKAQVSAEVRSFFDPVYPWLARSHLVICRAGSTTLAELAAAHMPAILIPLEGLAGNHQGKNAAWFVEKGAALVYRQHEPKEQFVYSIRSILESPERWADLSEKVGKLARPDAAKCFWDWINTLNYEHTP